MNFWMILKVTKLTTLSVNLLHFLVIFLNHICKCADFVIFFMQRRIWSYCNSSLPFSMKLLFLSHATENLWTEGVNFPRSVCPPFTILFQTTPQNLLGQLHPNFTGMINTDHNCAHCRHVTDHWFLSEFWPSIVCFILIEFDLTKYNFLLKL